MTQTIDINLQGGAARAGLVGNMLVELYRIITEVEPDAHINLVATSASVPVAVCFMAYCAQGVDALREVAYRLGVEDVSDTDFMDVNRRTDRDPIARVDYLVDTIIKGNYPLVNNEHLSQVTIGCAFPAFDLLSRRTVWFINEYFTGTLPAGDQVLRINDWFTMLKATQYIPYFSGERAQYQHHELIDGAVYHPVPFLDSEHKSFLLLSHQREMGLGFAIKRACQEIVGGLYMQTRYKKDELPWWVCLLFSQRLFRYRQIIRRAIRAEVRGGLLILEPEGQTGNLTDNRLATLKQNFTVGTQTITNRQKEIRNFVRR